MSSQRRSGTPSSVVNQIDSCVPLVNDGGWWRAIHIGKLLEGKFVRQMPHGHNEIANLLLGLWPRLSADLRTAKGLVVYVYVCPWTIGQPVRAATKEATLTGRNTGRAS